MRIPLLGGEKGDILSRGTTDASLQLHPVTSRDGLIVKVQPPREPSQKGDHVPCDIVLVIDVSGSMGTQADVPGESASESTGLSVLDLVKHAARTIIETLNEGDRLGIVTFCSRSRIVQPLTPMTDKNKNIARRNVENLDRLDATNLWHGILDGIKVFKEGGNSSRVSAMMVLTDGMPNHMCPNQGYVPKLSTMPPLPASIHTFGFGYNLRSGLLKSLAEFGSGNYAFIPDAGMIGTVFVHAVANLQTTYATKAVLELTYSAPLGLSETTGEAVNQMSPADNGQQRTLTISLGNLQYGQSRDIFLKVQNVADADPFDEKGLSTVQGKLTFHRTGTSVSNNDHATNTMAQCSMLADSDLPEAEIAYTESRARICSFLSSLFPMNAEAEHTAIELSQLVEKRDELVNLMDTIPAARFTDALNASLMEDLVGKEPRGQISLAINRDDYFRKWGAHYLPSLLNAHTRQICNTFKDSGPLQYGVNSPLFIACRNKLDNAFDQLPAPKPSLTKRSRGAISMSSYHNSAGVCFAASTPVEMASGREVAIRRLKRGMKVATPLGPRKVVLILKTPVVEETMCRVGNVLVTPWHPISCEGKTYVFPASVAEKAVKYTGTVYSVMLQGDGNSNAHAMKVGGLWGVTLGHGILSGNDVRAHEFFGDARSVIRSLVKLGVTKDGRVNGGGVVRNGKTGRVQGFKGPAGLAISK